MDFIFSCSDGSHVPVDTAHREISASVFLAFFSHVPTWYNLQSHSSDVFFVSPLDVSKPHQSCFPAHLWYILCFKSIPGVIVSQCVAARPSHIFIYVTSSLFTWELDISTVSIPYSISGWMINLWIFSFTCGGTPSSHMTTDIFLQLFHPHCVR